MNRTYYEDPKANLAMVKFTICGTNDKAFEGYPATGKKFSVDATEYIFFSAPTTPPGKVSGGDMYYDAATVLKQLGLVNATTGK